MSLVGVLWLILIVVKALGLALLSVSWWIIILWPLVPALIALVLITVFGATWFAGNSLLNRRRRF